LIMVYDLFNVLLDSFSKYFVEDFFASMSMRDFGLVSFVDTFLLSGLWVELFSRNSAVLHSLSLLPLIWDTSPMWLFGTFISSLTQICHLLERAPFLQIPTGAFYRLSLNSSPPRDALGTRTAHWLQSGSAKSFVFFLTVTPPHLIHTTILLLDPSSPTSTHWSLTTLQCPGILNTA
jgi:hypothetical protein